VVLQLLMYQRLTITKHCTVGSWWFTCYINEWFFLGGGRGEKLITLLSPSAFRLLASIARVGAVILDKWKCCVVFNLELLSTRIHTVIPSCLTTPNITMPTAGHILSKRVIYTFAILAAHKCCIQFWWRYLQH
jgi:hypothetical protein